MAELQRGVLLRTIIGSLIGSIAVVIIQFLGQNYILNHVTATYYNLYFFGRLPWIGMMGIALALVGGLSVVRLDYRQDPLPMVVRIGAIGLAVGVLTATIQQFNFQGVPFFFDFFVILAVNAGWFLVVAFLPYWITTSILQYVLGFARRSRSARGIMPPDLLAEVDARSKR